MTLNYNHLHYFHVAATEGSVAATAARLGVTQPTVSEQIRALERVLGVPLFERTATGLRLTDSGKIAYDHTAVIFAMGDRLLGALRPAPVDPRPELRIGVSAGVARSWSAEFLAPLFALHDCVVSVRSADTPELLRSVRGAELDVMLTETAPPLGETQGLEVVEIARSALVAVGMPTDDPGRPWKDTRIVRYRTTSSSRLAIDTYLERNELQANVAGESDDAQLLIEAAAWGDVVAFVPLAAARHAIAAGRVAVLATIESGEASIHALYDDGSSASLARRVVSLVVERARSLAPG